ncbi:outer membrane beta-barrel protein [Fibrella arboris]|uniref:outer membrane beta-barrel protein n=1 Tax=Fibrella arboris TaxID=3242486 RepID=UPI003522ABCC
MKNNFLFLAIACLTVQFAAAQTTQTRSFMIGPTFGLNKTSYVTDGTYSGFPTVQAPAGAFGGLDASYQLNHWLLGAKLLYQKQTYQATYPPFEYIIGDGPLPPAIYRTDTDYHLLSLPFSVGYRLTPGTRLQWFLGGTVEFNYTAETGQQTMFTSTGIHTVTDKATFGPVLDLGYGAQTTLRYAVSPQVALQFEPAVRYNPKDGYLLRARESYQLRGAFSVLVKL